MRYVRGAEIIEMRDEDDVVLNDFTRYCCCSYSALHVSCLYSMFVACTLFLVMTIISDANPPKNYEEN